jgi:glycosyltransferase involved in cell wall biosynthesis
MPTGSEPPTISVILLTYNHERYIEQAVRSVLEQSFTGPLEILVGEDCSTDRTPAILRRIDAECPGRLTLSLRPRNLGLSANLEDCWRRCRGRYIAILEGDDYWDDRMKLTTVVEYLNAHPESSGCYHACRRVSTVGWRKQTLRRPEHRPAAPLVLDDMFWENPIQSYSVMTYRRGLVTQFPEWHRRFACGDWVLHMLHAEHGPIGFLPREMAVYRFHPGGMMATLSMERQWREFFSIMERMDQHFQGRCSPQIAAARNRFIEQKAANYEYLQKIERRYRALGLGLIAAACRRIRLLWHRRPTDGSPAGEASSISPNAVVDELPRQPS